MYTLATGYWLYNETNYTCTSLLKTYKNAKHPQKTTTLIKIPNNQTTAQKQQQKNI